MIDKISYIESTTYDPYANLAMEEYLMLHCGETECILYLWQNAHTIVIGRNQNPWKECHLPQLEESGGHLVRRLSGGGAVYHDLGNVNFTFLVQKENYDVGRQLDVIIGAMRRLGIQAERSGRNDILADGKKFSGNAFYKQNKFCYHHGTIMLNVDVTKLSRYLNVSADKLKSKGVSSVKSRVTNLVEFVPDLTVARLKEALKESFEEVYGLKAGILTKEDLDQDALQKGRDRFISWEWLYGHNPTFENEMSFRFDWGGIDLCFSEEKGIIKEAVFYSDSLNPELMLALPEHLTGVIYQKDAICKALASHETADPQEQQMLSDILEAVNGEDF